MQWSQCVVGATGKILAPPRSVTVYAGDERATFWCLSTEFGVESLAWDFIPSSTGEKVNIAEGLSFSVNSTNYKYSVTRREGPNHVPCASQLATHLFKWYVLNILNVDHSDAGEYICREGAEITGKAKQDDEQYDSRSAYLTVLKLPMRQGKHSHYDSVQVGQ